MKNSREIMEIRLLMNVENGKNNISLDKIFALADALNVDVAELFRGLDS
ncbi:helix-turn-helix domain-containing protein [Streptomyces sp. MN13]